MKRLLAQVLPRSLFGRIVLLLTAGLIGAQLIGASIHLSERFQLLNNTIANEFAQQIASVYRTIKRQPTQDRADLAASLSRPRLQIAVVMGNLDGATGQAKDGRQALPLDFESRLSEALDPGVHWQMMQSPQIGSFTFDVMLELSDSQWLRVKGEPPAEVFGQPWHALMGLGFMLLAIVLLVLVVARSTVRPLTDLAKAAHGVAEDLKHPPLPEQGPAEVREAARAFNVMQQRIRDGIEERERFLAAVSHDLKTPVTRLRLRAEMLSDAKLRDDIAHDINEMQQLIDDSLDFLRGRSVDEPVQPIDLVALVESVADDFSRIGAVSVSAPASLRFKGRPMALQRAVRNLVDNAIKYGGSARIWLQQQQQTVVIRIDDDGEGLPADQLAAVFEPFYRAESSRSRETGGSGLGLAIVRQVAQSHGGDVTLSNRPQGGLRAEMVLPIT